MMCDVSRAVLHAYLDGELDAPRAAEFEKHLEGCTACVRMLEAQETLRSSIHRAQLRETVPQALETKIRNQMQSSRKPARPSALAYLQWLAAAAVLLLAIGVSWKIFPKLMSGSETSAFSAAVIDAHIRSLQPGHLTDVTSTDQHTVKPWFDGKVSFAPPVRDFTEEGFPLLGGRLDALKGQTVAALVYGRRKHFINVFVWPEHAGEREDYRGEKNGYRWISWRAGELRLCAVSDTNADDLSALKDLFGR